MIGASQSCAIAVRDIAAATAVYRDTLGARVSQAVPAARARRDNGLHRTA